MGLYMCLSLRQRIHQVYKYIHIPDALLKTKKFDNSGVAGIEPIRNETLESCTNNERCVKDAVMVLQST